MAEGLFGSVVGGVASMAGSAVKSAAKVAGAGVDAAGKVASTAASAAGSVASSAVSAASNVASSAVGAASSLASGALNSASSVAGSALSAAENIASSTLGTASGVLQSALGMAGDAASSVLGDVASAAQGALSGAGDILGDTMGLLSDMASDAASAAGDLAESILGNTSEELAKACGGCCGGGCGAAASAASSAAQAAQSACNAAVHTAKQTLEMVTSAMNNGVAALNSMNAAIGGMNGAVDLLTASLQKALDQTIAKMMAKIVSAIQAAHGITHPMFLSIFQMTWTENGQWKPGWGEVCSKWMKPLKEIPEYFDFIQKVMGGAINQVCGAMDKMFETVCEIGQMMYNGQISIDVNVSLSVQFPKPPLHVPLMSISKQIEDVMNKIMVIKEIIRQTAKQIIKKIKSLEAPELYINAPKEFFTILEVLVEAEFIYANLPIVMDKLLEYFLNLFVEKFAGRAAAIIDQIFSIWKKVTEIVPPLQDLLEMCWAIPNTADFCCNMALNIALPEMWSIVQPYIMAPFTCVQMV